MNLERALACATEPMYKFAIISDFPEEQWPSMDLSAETLAAHWPGFTPAAADAGPPDIVRAYVLHVGSNIARKRIDVLLEAFAAVRKRRPDVRLVKVGEPFTRVQRQQIDRLGLGGAVTRVENL